ncbi:MAG: diguanylate cyclase [Lachnospiraceae bacterium]|nr:diguanylate cyclase [Lachnospiraceae bacterium]
MDNKENKVKKIYAVLFSVLSLISIAYIIVSTDTFDKHYRDNLRTFSEGWITESGDVVNIDNVRTRQFDGTVVLEKTLPDDITDNDSVCFEAFNVNYSLYIDGVKKFSFKSHDNLSGKGYGSSYQEIGLCESERGKTVKFVFDGVYPEYGGGRITNVYLCPALDYIHMMVVDCLFSVSSSALILFMGVVLILIYACISDKSRLPFDIAAFGYATFILGFWLFIDTKFMQIFTGHIYLWRALNRIVIFFFGFPFIKFLNSLTALKRAIYERIAFLLSVIIVAVIVCRRYFFGVDMIESYPRALVVYVVALFIFVNVITIDNTLYCKGKGIAANMKYFFVGITFFLMSVFTDFMVYKMRMHTSKGYGRVTRVVTLLIIIVMLFRIIRWWTRNQQTIERDLFINKTMQYAISSDSPENSIKSMLEFMGEQLKARAILVFEEHSSGKYRVTNDWLDHGRTNEKIDLLYLPYNGFVDELHDTFMANNGKLIVDNVEKYKSFNPTLYNILKTNAVENLVASPLLANDKLVGLFVLIDVPKDLLEDTSEIIGINSYFLAQVITRRDEQKRLKFYSYNDPLSGALNRRAYKEYIESGLDMSSAFGYLVCKINEESEINDLQSLEAGDKKLVEMADTLREVFGEGHVYCVGSSELVAFGFESDETIFDNDVERVRKQMSHKELEAFIGAVYCTFGTMDISTVIHHANKLMRKEQKEKAGIPQ